MCLANKCKNLVSASLTALDPSYHIKMLPNGDDDVTVVISNVTVASSPLPQYRPTATRARHTMASAAGKLFGCPTPQHLNALTIATTQAIANTSTTSIFIMEGANVDNKHVSVKPLAINSPDGKQVQSIHMCDIVIPGLLTMLTGHIVPLLTVASLIGIRPLCKAGCKVLFDNEKYEVIFNNKVILTGYKDASSAL